MGRALRVGPRRPPPSRPSSCATRLVRPCDEWGEAAVGAHSHGAGPELAGAGVAVGLGAREATVAGRGTGELVAGCRRGFGGGVAAGVDPVAGLGLLGRRPGAWRESRARSAPPAGVAECLDGLDGASPSRSVTMLSGVAGEEGVGAAGESMLELVRRGGDFGRGDLRVLSLRPLSGVSGPDPGPDLSEHDRAFLGKGAAWHGGPRLGRQAQGLREGRDALQPHHGRRRGELLGRREGGGLQDAGGRARLPRLEREEAPARARGLPGPEDLRGVRPVGGEAAAQAVPGGRDDVRVREGGPEPRPVRPGRDREDAHARRDGDGRVLHGDEGAPLHDDGAGGAPLGGEEGRHGEEAREIPGEGRPDPARRVRLRPGRPGRRAPPLPGDRRELREAVAGHSDQRGLLQAGGGADRRPGGGRDHRPGRAPRAARRLRGREPQAPTRTDAVVVAES